MDKDLVIGLDSSTSATKAIAWTATGTAVAEGRCPIPLSRPAADWYEQNADDWWKSACTALQRLLTTVSPVRIAALAISAQRETFVALAADESPCRPAIVWLDQRCRKEVPWLSRRVGRRKIHEISGKPVDMAPVAYRLAWMLRNEPNLYKRTVMVADVHGYLTWRLSGRMVTSWTSADPLGIFDLQKKAWSQEILGALDLTPAQVPEAVAPGTVMGYVDGAAAEATSLPRGTPIVAGGGDGQAAGLAVNALTPGRAYLNLGTAVVSGIQSAEYRIGQAWRTMGSGCGEGYYLETSLRSGTFLIDWFVQQFGGLGDAASRRRLEGEAAELPAGSGGLLTVPYWGAVMTPYWDPDARGCLVGLSPTHGAGHVYRSLLEGIALEQSMITGMIERETGPIREFAAVGGGAASDLWCQIFADVCAKPVWRSPEVEASSLGAAMCAAAGAGWFATVTAAAEGMSSGMADRIEPCPDRVARYAELLEAYRGIYPQLRQTYRKLAAFRERSG